MVVTMFPAGLAASIWADKFRSIGQRTLEEEKRPAVGWSNRKDGNVNDGMMADRPSGD